MPASVGSPLEPCTLKRPRICTGNEPVYISDLVFHTTVTASAARRTLTDQVLGQAWTLAHAGAPLTPLSVDGQGQCLCSGQS